MKNLKQLVKNIFHRQPPFEVKPCHAYCQYEIEGSTIVLHRTVIEYPSPSVAGLIRFKSGIKITLKKGYCAIMHFPEQYIKTGLIPVQPVQVFNHGHISEIEITCYQSWNSHFADSAKAFEPFAIGDIIGFLTIVKTV